MTDKSAMRTALGQVRGLGSAKDGTDHFIRQRLTAILNVPLILAFIIIIISLNGESYESVVATLANPLIALIMAGVIVCVTIHMRIGMQVIIEDYIHHELTKIACLVASTFFSLAIAFASIFALLKIAFGG